MGKQQSIFTQVDILSDPHSTESQHKTLTTARC
jgi:hypothetical protein